VSHFVSKINDFFAIKPQTARFITINVTFAASISSIGLAESLASSPKEHYSKVVSQKLFL